MRTKTAPVEVVCVQCARPFIVSQRAYVQRTARYGAALRCPHCIADRSLAARRSRLPREGSLASPNVATVVISAK